MAGKINLRLKRNSIPSINLPGEDRKLSLQRKMMKERRDDRMRQKSDDTVNNSDVGSVMPEIDIPLDEPCNGYEDSAENIGLTSSEPISTYQDLLEIIERQKQHLEILEETILKLQQELSSKPQVNQTKAFLYTH